MPNYPLRCCGRAPLSLAEHEKAVRVMLRDYEQVHTRISQQLEILRAWDNEYRALVCVAPLPASLSTYYPLVG